MDLEFDSWLPLYVKHVLIAWPGIFFATLVIGVLVSSTPLAYLFSPDLNAPIFPGMVISGLVAGFYFNRQEPTRAALFAFLLPLTAFIWMFSQDVGGPAPYGGWAYAWQMNFTRHCGATECLGLLLATGPLYAGISYSLGAWAALRRSRLGQAQIAPD